MTTAIEFPVSNTLAEKGITRIAKEGNTFVVDYQNGQLWKIRVGIKKDWNSTTKAFEKEAEEIISDKLVIQAIKSFMSEQYLTINERTASTDDEEADITDYVPYWQDGKVIYEAILTDNGPAFLCYDGSKFSIAPEILEGVADDGTKQVIKPVEETPYEPYYFSDEEIQKLGSTPADSALVEKIFQTILDTIGPYQDTPEANLNIDAAGILLSYLQHKVKTVPYIAKIGAPESGKTRSNSLIAWLAYRPLMAVNMTAANIYRYYGKKLQAAGTIVHDEIDDGDIDKDKAMLSIYNAGYKYGAKVPRIGGEHQERQDYWNCFGIKWFSGTELPYSKTFRSRCIVQNFMQGQPERIDITDEDEEIFRSVRKSLLILRMLKGADKLPPVKTQLKGRSRELYSPLLAVVQGTKWYDILHNQFTALDEKRKEDDRESKQAYIARAVIDYWIDQALERLKLKSEDDLTPQRLETLKEAIFVPNDQVIVNMMLSETTNDKGKKILVNDEIPYSYTKEGIGKIQVENLKGEKDSIWMGEGDKRKKVRGYYYDLKTIRQLQTRYGTPGTHGTLGTLGTVSREGVELQNGQKSLSSEPKNEPKTGDNPTQTAVPTVPTVPEIPQDKKALFWMVFDGLAENGIVRRDKLHQQLVASGKVDAGQATVLIQDMEKAGHIVNVEEAELQSYRKAQP